MSLSEVHQFTEKSGQFYFVLSKYNYLPSELTMTYFHFYISQCDIWRNDE